MRSIIREKNNRAINTVNTSIKRILRTVLIQKLKNITEDKEANNAPLDAVHARTLISSTINPSKAALNTLNLETKKLGIKKDIATAR